MALVRGKYKDEEIQFILNNHHKMSITEMAEELNRTYMSVAHKRRELGLSPEPIREKENERKGGFTKSKVNRYKKNFKVGQRYLITPVINIEELTENYHSDYYMEFEATLIKITRDLLVFDKGAFKECIRISDVVRGFYVLEEVE